MVSRAQQFELAPSSVLTATTASMLKNALSSRSNIKITKTRPVLRTAQTFFTSSSLWSERQDDYDLGDRPARPTRPNFTPRPERYRTDDRGREEYARREFYRRDDYSGSRDTGSNYRVRDDTRQNDSYTSRGAAHYDRKSYGDEFYDRREGRRSRPDELANHSGQKILLPRTPAAAPPVARPEDLVELIQAIRKIFPHVKNPTQIQAELIPAIHQGSDVLLMDETGSGK